MGSSLLKLQQKDFHEQKKREGTVSDAHSYKLYPVAHGHQKGTADLTATAHVPQYSTETTLGCHRISQ